MLAGSWAIGGAQAISNMAQCIKPYVEVARWFNFVNSRRRRVGDLSRAINPAERPQDDRQIDHRGNSDVLGRRGSTSGDEIPGRKRAAPIQPAAGLIEEENLNERVAPGD